MAQLNIDLPPHKDHPDFDRWLLQTTQYLRDYLGLYDSSTESSFIQSGTGAVTRTAQSKMRDVVSVKDFGATGDGVTDDTATIQAAIDTFDDHIGGTLYFPFGVYKCASALDLSGHLYLNLQGVSGVTTGGYAATGSVLSFSGTGAGNFINMAGCIGCELNNLYITHSSESFTGNLVVGGTSMQMCAFRDCSFSGTAGNDNTANGIDIDISLEITFARCAFFRLVNAVVGQHAAGWSNVVQFLSCYFQDTTNPPIAYCGESWSFRDCVFERLLDGTAGAISTVSSTPVKGLVFDGNWLGDVTGAGGVWLSLYGTAINITGNMFGGEGTNTTAIQLHSVSGYKITGNIFDTFATAIDYGTTLCIDGYVFGNTYSTVTSIFGNPTNQSSFLQAATGYLDLPNGMIIQWGIEADVTTSGATVTLPKAYTTANYVVLLSLYGAGASGTVPGVSSQSATQFVIANTGADSTRSWSWWSIGM